MKVNDYKCTKNIKAVHTEQPVHYIQSRLKTIALTKFQFKSGKIDYFYDAFLLFLKFKNVIFTVFAWKIAVNP